MQISDNEMYLLIKYIKSVLWKVAKCLSYIEETRCLKVNGFLVKRVIHSSHTYYKLTHIKNICRILPWKIFHLLHSYINVGCETSPYPSNRCKNYR